MRIVWAWACILLSINVAGGQTHPAANHGYRIAAPVVHENLAVFMITGSETLPKSAGFATLSEAMDKKLVIVHETGNVNELAIENVSDTATVVVLSGSIVKGGKQDRVLSTDLVLQPASGRVPIASFCVEQSRWSQRNDEAVGRFEESRFHVSGKGLRKAVKGGRGQSEVWQNVAAEQARLTQNIGRNVQANDSPTSLQLAVENKQLQQEIGRWRGALQDVPQKHPQAVGYAITINGEFSTADIYASRGLFLKAWQQHLDSAITEAISLRNEKGKKQPDLTWQQRLFDTDFQRKFDRQTAGINRYQGEQSQTLFRFNCRLDGNVLLRQSFEPRAKGETLRQNTAPLDLQTDSENQSSQQRGD